MMLKRGILTDLKYQIKIPPLFVKTSLNHVTNEVYSNRKILINH